MLNIVQGEIRIRQVFDLFEAFSFPPDFKHKLIVYYKIPFWGNDYGMGLPEHADKKQFP